MNDDGAKRKRDGSDEGLVSMSDFRKLSLFSSSCCRLFLYKANYNHPWHFHRQFLLFTRLPHLLVDFLLRQMAMEVALKMVVAPEETRKRL